MYCYQLVSIPHCYLWARVLSVRPSDWYRQSASVDRTDQINPGWGLRSNGVLGSSQRTLRFL